MLSGEYRRAVAAEAAGDYVEAARHYALAGDRDKVAEMHLLRAERAVTAAEAEAELRDALRWTDAGTPARVRVARALGSALLKRAHTEGAVSARDRARVSEAAALLGEAGELREAGAAHELLGDDEGAARAYEQGGHVEEMEAALARERARRRGAGDRRDAFHEYETRLALGARRAALRALARCAELSDDKAEAVRLAAELGARLPVGAVTLRRHPDGPPLRFVAAAPARLGRDPEVGIALRAPGVSRTHAEIRFAAGGFHLVDAGSRHGTWLAELPLAAGGQVPLAGSGRLRLGSDCELGFRADGALLELEVVRGLDRGARFLVVPPQPATELAPLLGLPARLRFDGPQPILEGDGLRLGGEPVAGPIELARGDRVDAAGGSVDVV
jgi:hypothetical protein